MPDTTAPGAAPDTASTEAARERLAATQTALLAALTAGAPPPEGFDPERLRVQARALVAKRAAVVARLAPELPRILGDGYRPAFTVYADGRPLTGGHRQDALRFAAHLLESGTLSRTERRELRRWYRERSGGARRGWGPAGRLLRRLLTGA